ncbi:hypothetical protein Pan216_26320 [Planctomycetes bacterium Pan216]|uniref:Uncharacterized protein n=1 Tax=Kolteria novifilia TaxID=2527975 RepID=A0A518B463_9BACT|nr:hypothetical protein Pan216_26320 [Planctomycetes bacterium Pan216]
MSLTPFPTRPPRHPVKFALTLGLSALLAIGTAVPALACPFCSQMGRSFSDDIRQSDLTVYGTIENSRVSAESSPGQTDGETTMSIESVLKPHPILGKKKKVTFPRYIPTANKSPEDYLILAEVVDGRIDPYRGMPVEDRRFVTYLSESMSLDAAKADKRLGYFFNYLGDDDVNISGDAYKEFANAPYEDVLAAGKSYDPDKIVEWLADKKTPTYRYGLYGLLLGIGGESKHEAVLREYIEDENKRPVTGTDGLLAGYCLLNPQAGIAFVASILNNPKNSFEYRYSALKAIRFVLDQMPDVDKKVLFAELKKALNQPDIADLVIKELRVRGQWEVSDEVLALAEKPKYDHQLMRRAILRYALQCPGDSAKAYVEKVRKETPQFVKDTEAVLRIEQEQSKQIENRQ